MCENPFMWEVTDKEKIININPYFAEIEIARWRTYIQNTKEAFTIERNSSGSLKTLVVLEECVVFLNKWLDYLVDTIRNKKCSPDELDVLLEIIRALRNAASDHKVQNLIIHKTSISSTILELFYLIIERNSRHTAVKILLQFLHNLLTTNEESVSSLYSQVLKICYHCFQNFLHELECSALTYQIFLKSPFYDKDIFSSIIDTFKVNSNEFLYFLFETCFTHEAFWENTYKNLDIDRRLIILEFLKHLHLKKGSLNLHDSGLDMLIKTFLSSSDVIFQTKIKDGNNNHIEEVSYILEIISSISSDLKYREQFSNKDLLINTGVLLINIHKLGKNSDNCFTPIQKLSEFGDGNENLNKHPAFGFKADLIRLIGNICCKNADMQNLARSAELIPIVLDCCNMDALNPFIIQWSILAVKNLCENNLENQKIIASLHRQGVVTNETLSEMGITLHSEGDNNQVNIVPLDAFSKQ